MSGDSSGTGPRLVGRRAALREAAAVAVGASLAGVTPAEASPAPRGLFDGRVVLITGATSGIGEGCARAFAAQGARVFFCGRREALGADVQASIRAAGGDAAYMRADVRVEDDVRRFVDACVTRYGRIDVALNNAGIAAPRHARMAEQPLADFDDVMRTNAHGVFLCMKHEMPHLLANAPAGPFGTRGVVINTASTSGRTGFAMISPYSASKHAVIGLTRCAALEYSPLGVRVLSFSPGGVNTPMREAAYAGRIAPGAPLPPAPNLFLRANTVEEMAHTVLFLASDAASALTGTDVDVTGGFHTGAHFTQAR